MSARVASLHVFRIPRGLGNACALVFPDRTLGIVDWGSQDEELLQEVLALATSGRIRFVAATHPHADHTLGLDRLFTACAEAGLIVDRFVFPVISPPIGADSDSTDPLTRALITAYRLRKTLKCELQQVVVSTLYEPGTRPPLVAHADNWEVRVLAPASEATGAELARALSRGTVAGNPTSLVLGFRFVGTAAAEGIGRVLLPGDATPKTLEFARSTAVRFPELTLANQAIVVPHHGGGSTIPQWFEESIQGIAVISAPTASPHHPQVATLQQLARVCSTPGPSRLYCTSYAGACEERFRQRATGSFRKFVAPGPCFGHLVVRVPRDDHASVVRSSHPGDKRRPFGVCGHA